MKNFHSQQVGKFSEMCSRNLLTSDAEWSDVVLYPALAYLSAKNGAFVLGAPEMSENQEWVETSMGMVRSSFAAGTSLRKHFSPWLWRLAAFIDEPSRNVRKLRRRALQLFEPVYKQYREGSSAASDMPSTGMQWYIQNNGGRPLSLEEITDDQLFLSLAAVHTTSASLQNTICDLVERPELLKELAEEVRSLCPADGRWTAPRLAKMVKLDSFMKESQRVHAIALRECPLLLFIFILDLIFSIFSIFFFLLSRSG